LPIYRGKLDNLCLDIYLTNITAYDINNYVMTKLPRNYGYNITKEGNVTVIKLVKLKGVKKI